MSRRRTLTAALMVVAVAAVATACGAQDIKLDKADRENASMRRGATLFAERCAGCHTLKNAGSQGTSVLINDRERVDGPNFDVRKEEVAQVLYAIRNGGFSGAVMPQNLVVGRDAQDVARFLARYAGRDATSPPSPGSKVQPSGGPRPEAPGATDEPQGRPPAQLPR